MGKSEDKSAWMRLRWFVEAELGIMCGFGTASSSSVLSSKCAMPHPASQRKFLMQTKDLGRALLLQVSKLAGTLITDDCYVGSRPAANF